jgi:predicted transcriptional regulator
MAAAVTRLTPAHTRGPLTEAPALFTLKRMEVHFTQETEARLKQLAASKGKDATQVVEETVARMLERQAQFIEGVNRGIAAADRGDLIDHEEVVNRIQRLLES